MAVVGPLSARRRVHSRPGRFDCYVVAAVAVVMAPVVVADQTAAAMGTCQLAPGLAAVCPNFGAGSAAAVVAAAVPYSSNC